MARPYPGANARWGVKQYSPFAYLPLEIQMEKVNSHLQAAGQFPGRRPGFNVKSVTADFSEAKKERSIGEIPEFLGHDHFRCGHLSNTYKA